MQFITTKSSIGVLSGCCVASFAVSKCMENDNNLVFFKTAEAQYYGTDKGDGSEPYDPLNDPWKEAFDANIPNLDAKTRELIEKAQTELAEDPDFLAIDSEDPHKCFTDEAKEDLARYKVD